MLHTAADTMSAERSACRSHSHNLAWSSPPRVGEPLALGLMSRAVLECLLRSLSESIHNEPTDIDMRD